MGRKRVIFIISFIISKGAVFIGPILLSIYIPISEYGIVEYALSTGGLLAAILNMGTSTAYPYFILKKQEIGKLDGFALHGVILSVPMIMINIYYLINQFKPDLFMVIFMTYMIANQRYFSVVLKSSERIVKAVYVDSMVYVILIGFVALVYFEVIHNNYIKQLNYFFVVYSFAIAFYRIFLFVKSEHKRIINKFLQIIKYGNITLISSFLILFLTIYPKIVLGYFLGDEEVGIYSFYFRIASVVIVFYQLVAIAYFRKIYQSNPYVLDKLFSVFLMIILLFNIVVSQIAPMALLPYFPMLKETYASNKLVFFVLNLHMVSWIWIALNENIIYRENMAKSMNWFLIGIVIVIIGSSFILDHFGQISIENITIVHFFSINVLAILQVVLMYLNNGIKFKKTVIVGMVNFIIMLGIWVNY